MALQAHSLDTQPQHAGRDVQVWPDIASMTWIEITMYKCALKWSWKHVTLGSVTKVPLKACVGRFVGSFPQAWFQLPTLPVFTGWIVISNVLAACAMASPRCSAITLRYCHLRAPVACKHLYEIFSLPLGIKVHLKVLCSPLQHRGSMPRNFPPQHLWCSLYADSRRLHGEKPPASGCHARPVPGHNACRVSGNGVMSCSLCSDTWIKFAKAPTLRSQNHPV